MRSLLCMVPVLVLLMARQSIGVGENCSNSFENSGVDLNLYYPNLEEMKALPLLYYSYNWRGKGYEYSCVVMLADSPYVEHNCAVGESGLLVEVNNWDFKCKVVPVNLPSPSTPALSSSASSTTTTTTTTTSTTSTLLPSTPAARSLGEPVIDDVEPKDDQPAETTPRSNDSDESPSAENADKTSDPDTYDGDEEEMVFDDFPFTEASTDKTTTLPANASQEDKDKLATDDKNEPADEDHKDEPANEDKDKSATEDKDEPSDEDKVKPGTEDKDEPADEDKDEPATENKDEPANEDKDKPTDEAKDEPSDEDNDDPADEDHKEPTKDSVDDKDDKADATNPKDDETSDDKPSEDKDSVDDDNNDHPEVTEKSSEHTTDEATDDTTQASKDENDDKEDDKDDISVNEDGHTTEDDLDVVSTSESVPEESQDDADDHDDRSDWQGESIGYDKNYKSGVYEREANEVNRWKGKYFTVLGFFLCFIVIFVIAVLFLIIKLKKNRCEDQRALASSPGHSEESEPMTQNGGI
eukprot:TRINITY_DN399_c0_g1_i1.p1 TRINITY_DN399_c0_g1~~TRINITY_DN399_c0_g1_i1.p1  ORF type:complete len:526 (-),score=142.50 TRINITY_DN399_c0_g1_i1:168-1745(-)